MAIRLTAQCRGNMLLPIFVTISDALIQPSKCNSYANVFPMDAIETQNYDHGPIQLCFPSSRMQTANNAGFLHVHCNSQTPFIGLSKKKEKNRKGDLCIVPH